MPSNDVRINARVPAHLYRKLEQVLILKRGQKRTKDTTLTQLLITGIRHVVALEERTFRRKVRRGQEAIEPFNGPLLDIVEDEDGEEAE